MASIDDFKEDILQLHTGGASINEMLGFLGREAVTVSKATLCRRMKDWGLATKTQEPTTEFLVDRVKSLYQHHLYSNTKIAATISEQDGLNPTVYQVKTIRQKAGLLRRVQSRSRISERHSEIRTQQQATTRQLIHNMLTNGPGRSYGIRFAQTHLHEAGYRTQRQDVTDALREFAPQGLAGRNPRRERHKLHDTDYTTPGPYSHWVCDGHDKLSKYGIQVYAGIDAYSRKLIWFYCGNANRSQFSVANQYLQAIRACGHCPKFVRTDHGAETVLLAAIQLTFYLESRANEGVDISEIDQINALMECYIYGLSTLNTRIERLWRTLRDTVTGKWLKLFALISRQDLFREKVLLDRIALLYVFMPLIRQELIAFVTTKNAHNTRYQKDCPYHKPGVLNELINEGTDYSFSIDLNGPGHSEWSIRVASFGIVTNKFTAFFFSH